MIKRALIFGFGMMLWARMGDNAWAQYLGGVAQGYAFGIYSTQDVATIGSTTQNFTVGAGSTAASNIEVVLLSGAPGGGINTTNGIRVNIPSDLDMVWDSSVTTATITGNASGDVSTTVSYANSNQTLVLTVTSNFTNNNFIIISGLSFKSFTGASSDFLTLEVDGADQIASDLYKKFINYSAISGNTDGGVGQGYSMYRYDTQQGQLFFGTGI